MKHLRTAHLWIGVISLIAFALTGQYMHWVLDHLRGMADGPRLFLRSSHIFLLWSGLLNLVLGCYLSSFSSRTRNIAQAIGSIAILVAPVLLCVSFFFDAYNDELTRPFARFGIYLPFAGVLVHFLASLRARSDGNS